MFQLGIPMRRLASALLLALLTAPVCAQGQPRVVVVPVDQAIHPVTKRFITRAITEAADSGAQCVILQLDTPGGMLESTRDIVKDILTAEIPVVVFVAPAGARASSAGVFITLAAQVSAMAPGTNIGAAHPIAGAPFPGAPGELGGDGIQQILSAKITNDAVAWARALAELRGRNADWAGRAVKDSISTPAKDARAENVVDLLATDQADLLTQLNGRKVALLHRVVFLQTTDAIIERIEMSWPERALSLLANPTLAYMLLLLSFAGLTFELTHPGGWIPGILGAICLILAFFAMQMLPINYAGLALIVLGLALVGLEVKIHSYGILTAVGVLCLLVGSAMLIEPVEGIERVSWLVTAPVSIALALIVLLLVSNIVRAHQAKVCTGIEPLIGALAEVRGDLNGQGFVFIAGELWQARCEVPLQNGESVRIERCDGLMLHVRPASALDEMPDIKR